MTPDGFHLNSASSFVDQVQTGPTTATVGMVTPSADLSIAKSDSADPVLPGDSLTYTVTVSNAGPSAANDVAVTDTLPAGVTFVSSSGCTEDPNGVPTLHPGDDRRVRLGPVHHNGHGGFQHQRHLDQQRGRHLEHRRSRRVQQQHQ